MSCSKSHESVLKLYPLSNYLNFTANVVSLMVFKLAFNTTQHSYVSSHQPTAHKQTQKWRLSLSSSFAPSSKLVSPMIPSWEDSHWEMVKFYFLKGRGSPLDSSALEFQISGMLGFGMLKSLNKPLYGLQTETVLLITHLVW